MAESDERLASPAGEWLVNLTGHPIEIESHSDAAGDETVPPRPTSILLPPAGLIARVDDGRAVLGEDAVRADSELVSLRRLRRSTRLVDLPPARPGTRLVVSRLTALAARHRTDLVFPFGDIKDAAGRVTGSRGLACFPAGLALAQRYRSRRVAARQRRAERPEPRQWLTGVLFATATALLSGAIALLPGAFDDATAHGWGTAWQTWTLRLGSAFATLGAGLLSWAAWRWHRREALLAGRGTAYVIEEEAINWRHEERLSVLTAIAKGSAAMLRVPGPAQLGENWRWRADADDARHWDERIDQLVHSFWAVHFNDDQVTRNGLFTWAPWPVAMAFGARATARRRGLILHVRQRPSHSPGGPRKPLQLTGRAHDFLRLGPPTRLRDVAPELREQTSQAVLTIKFEPFAAARVLGQSDRSLTRARTDQPPLPAGQANTETDAEAGVRVGIEPAEASTSEPAGRSTPAGSARQDRAAADARDDRDPAPSPQPAVDGSDKTEAPADPTADCEPGDAEPPASRPGPTAGPEVEHNGPATVAQSGGPGTRSQPDGAAAVAKPANSGLARTEPAGCADPAGATDQCLQPAGTSVLLLVVRVTHGPVGPIALDLDQTQPFTVAICRDLAGDRAGGSVITPGSTEAAVAEWRLVPVDPEAARVPDLPWDAFPAVAEYIADWIVAQAAAHPDRVVLLTARMPQELAIGLGIQLGQRSAERALGKRWPHRLYPVFYDGEQLVIPRLRLGADSVPPHRQQAT